MYRITTRLVRNILTSVVATVGFAMFDLADFPSWCNLKGIGVSFQDRYGKLLQYTMNQEWEIHFLKGSHERHNKLNWVLLNFNFLNLLLFRPSTTVHDSHISPYEKLIAHTCNFSSRLLNLKICTPHPHPAHVGA